MKKDQTKYLDFKIATVVKTRPMRTLLQHIFKFILNACDIFVSMISAFISALDLLNLSLNSSFNLPKIIKENIKKSLDSGFYAAEKGHGLGHGFGSWVTDLMVINNHKCSKLNSCKLLKI